MTDGVFPSALREVRQDLTKRPVIVGVLSLGVLLGISGPFDTFSVLPALPRLLYWTSVVSLTFVTGSLTSTIVHRLLQKRPNWLQLVVSICAVGIVVTATLELFNLATLGFRHETLGDLLRQLGVVTLISGVIEAGSLALRSAPAPQRTRLAPLLDRLPLNKRGQILALGAEDHYVRVTTHKGSELVLLRLSDAMKEVGETRGLQIHRSHWVALDQITNVTRTGDRGQVTLSDGTSRPISRRFLPAIRDAGLLPGKTRGPARSA